MTGPSAPPWALLLEQFVARHKHERVLGARMLTCEDGGEVLAVKCEPAWAERARTIVC